MSNKLQSIFPIKGVVQNYAWGGFSFLPELLHKENPEHKPWAEYWMGAHPKAPAIDLNNDEALNEIITSDPAKTVGEKVWNRFGELPYLFKVLDVNEMLSIQVHPSKSEAEKGFDAENTKGISLADPTRNYKDRNHKPEVMVALSEFWLLHGFLSEEKLKNVLQTVPEFNQFASTFGEGDYKALYQKVMELSTEEADKILFPIIERELANKKAGALDRSLPGWWVAKLYENEIPQSNIDKGIFSIYFFNIVKANPGEAVFQAAGIPHAYLEGQNMELMANSDNVLRGGLTPKHVDVPELLKHTSFVGVTPNVMAASPETYGEINFPCPVPDFGLSMLRLKNEQTINSTSFSLEIYFVEQGRISLQSGDQTLILEKGNAAAILSNTEYTITAAQENTIAFKAFVPEL